MLGLRGVESRRVEFERCKVLLSLMTFGKSVSGCFSRVLSQLRNAIGGGLRGFSVIRTILASYRYAYSALRACHGKITNSRIRE